MLCNARLGSDWRLYTDVRVPRYVSVMALVRFVAVAQELLRSYSSYVAGAECVVDSRLVRCDRVLKTVPSSGQGKECVHSVRQARFICLFALSEENNAYVRHIPCRKNAILTFYPVEVPCCKLLSILKLCKCYVRTGYLVDCVSWYGEDCHLSVRLMVEMFGAAKLQ
jgi:hypothetical protein